MRVDERLNPDKIPPEIAIFVSGYDTGLHAVIIGADDQQYLIHLEETARPEISSICILVATYESPEWDNDPENWGKGGAVRFTLDRTFETLTTWKIKK